MRSKDYSSLGKRIVIEATKRNMRMYDVASLLGMPSYNYLSKVLYGRVGIGPKYAEAVADFLKVDKEDVPCRDRGRNWESKKAG